MKQKLTEKSRVYIDPAFASGRGRFAIVLLPSKDERETLDPVEVIRTKGEPIYRGFSSHRTTMKYLENLYHCTRVNFIVADIADRAGKNQRVRERDALTWIKDMRELGYI